MKNETKETLRFKSEVCSILSDIYDNLESNMRFYMDTDEATGKRVYPQSDYDRLKYEAYKYIIENISIEI